jgi:FKBP-type peptidyl-prolyl cis-trans isomerase 2
MKNNSQFGKCALVHWKGGVQGEEPIDDRSQGEPVRIILGAGQVCPGIEDALSEMKPGEERVVVVPPEQAYGRHDPDGVQVYPRTMLPSGYELNVGDVFAWTNPASGQQIPVRVIEAQEDSVKVDFNHPFADKTIEYWLRIESIVGE